jgi:hypothetical protein
MSQRRKDLYVFTVSINNSKFNEKLTELLGFLDFFHRPVFYKIENTMFRKLDLFPSSGDAEKTPTQLGSLERANLNHRFLFSRIPDDGKSKKKNNDSVCYTPSLEPFRIYLTRNC